MRFSLEKALGGCRLGVITCEASQKVCKEGTSDTQDQAAVDMLPPEVTNVQTPACMLYTRCASAAHLSRDLLDRMSNLPGIAQMPLTRLTDHQETLTAFKRGIKELAAMQNFMVYSSIQDPAEKVASGYNDKSGVAVWGKGGKTKLDVDSFMALQEGLRPDWFQALADSDTDDQSMKKRVRKSVDRTLVFLDQIIEKCAESEVLKHSGIIGTVLGGYDLNERKRSAKETAKRPVSGFCIEGFHNNGPERESFHLQDIEHILGPVMEILPENLPRILTGPLPPDQVLLAIEMGVDVTDTAYAYLATERGSALNFNYNLHKELPDDVDNGAENLCSCDGFEINLKEKRYIDDFSPLVEGCHCYACQKHTRSYINHLLNTSELLAGTLLMMHNMEHFCGFMNTVRESIKTGTFEKLKSLINNQRPKR